jgi:carbamoyl-phosphate synthase small subunit
MKSKKRTAKLILEDGTVYEGYAFGANNAVSGGVVFSTGMVGYPESLTDPSYRGQILTLTYPLIGNYGVPGYEREDGLFKYFESDKIQPLGLIVSEDCEDYSHWNGKKSLSEWLQEYNVPGIYGIDTRALTKRLREKGVMLGKIVYDDNDMLEFVDHDVRNLAAEVCVPEPVVYERSRKKVIIVDCGVKNNIIRAFLNRNITQRRERP